DSSTRRPSTVSPSCLGGPAMLGRCRLTVTPPPGTPRTGRASADPPAPSRTAPARPAGCPPSAGPGQLSTAPGVPGGARTPAASAPAPAGTPRPRSDPGGTIHIYHGRDPVRPQWTDVVRTAAGPGYSPVPRPGDTGSTAPSGVPGGRQFADPGRSAAR